MIHAAALKVAESLMEHFRPACTRIEIAGSVRRLKMDVKDIELVLVPDPAPVAREPLVFGQPIPKKHQTQLDKLVWEMAERGDIRIEANGDRYKKFYLKYAGIKVDMFINLAPSQWGVQMVIRTGSAEFSHWIVSQRKIGGALPNGYFVKHQVVWDAEEIKKADVPYDPNKAAKLLNDFNHLPMLEEKDFLEFCGLGWIEPKDRVARWNR
jgi:DNA polymerase/3'-5' exonuclease PolX